MHICWDWVGSSLLHTKAKAGAVSGTALSLAFTHAYVCPCAPTSSHSMERMLSETSESSEQAKPPGSMNTCPSSPPGSPKLGMCLLFHLDWYLRSHTPGSLPDPFLPCPEAAKEPLTVFSLITSDVWLATLFARLCLYSVPGWPRPLGDKKNVCL